METTHSTDGLQAVVGPQATGGLQTTARSQETDNLMREIDAYRDEHWSDILADIEALVEIESVEDLARAREGAPFGPGPRAALDRALAIAGRMGLATGDCEGYIGFADLPGASDTQVGIIGHVDVVPAGPGWTFAPYVVTRRDGYLLGRGVIDDKGPLMVALHAVKFWKDKAAEQGERLPYTIRVLFGANEETNMKDVEYYRAHYDDPAFLFTPDSQFPVGYGESGICSGTIMSAPIEGGQIIELQGGQAVNAVPGEAWAIVRNVQLAARVPGEDGGNGERRGYACDGNMGTITLSRMGDDTVRIEAHGVSAHASTPELGENAIAILVDYLLATGVGTPEERAFLALERAVLETADGSALGIACSDGHFGALTAVGGVVALERGRISQTIDFRYPTTTTAEQIAATVQMAAAKANATFTMEHDKAPFLMDPFSPAVRALLDAYRAVTGEDAQGLTSKGGTYARCFTTGVSFGPEKPWESDPSWVGGMHGPDEGVSEDLLKQAFSVYAYAIGNLMQVEF